MQVNFRALFIDYIQNGNFKASSNIFHGSSVQMKDTMNEKSWHILPVNRKRKMDVAFLFGNV